MPRGLSSTEPAYDTNRAGGVRPPAGGVGGDARGAV